MKTVTLDTYTEARAALLNRELRQTLKYLEQDEKAGRRIQFQLLPEDNRTFGGYTFRRRLYPSTYLSGDFVDYFPIDDRHVGFYMADVSGHGAASAFVTVIAAVSDASACTTRMPRPPPPPAALMMTG